MDENHQDAAGSKLIVTEDKSQLAFKTAHKWTGFKGKTLWDWLQLLIIPLVLAVGGFVYGAWQHDADQNCALDQQHATVLQTYIEGVSPEIRSVRAPKKRQQETAPEPLGWES